MWTKSICAGLYLAAETDSTQLNAVQIPSKPLYMNAEQLWTACDSDEGSACKQKSTPHCTEFKLRFMAVCAIIDADSGLRKLEISWKSRGRAGYEARSFWVLCPMAWGAALDVPHGWELQLFVRSSLAFEVHKIMWSDI